MKNLLTSDDLRIALVPIKIAQKQYFKQEIECVTNNNRGIKNKSILRLNPFIDEDNGLLNNLFSFQETINLHP